MLTPPMCRALLVGAAGFQSVNIGQGPALGYPETLDFSHIDKSRQTIGQ